MSTKPKSSPVERKAASTRINLRIESKVKGILLKAAALQQVNLTEFMIRSSRVAAEMVLAERTRIALPPEKWREFNAALDAPPREIPALRRLFTEPPVFRPA